MSTLWCGRACWAAVVVLLINQVSANSAIITTETEAGYYDVSLNITHIDLMPGLNHWDDLAFTSLQEPRFSEYGGSMGMDVWEKLAVLDMASGKLCQTTDGCIDNIASHYQSMCDAESQEPHNKVKRYRYIGSWLNTGWKTSSSHAVKAAALGALSSTVGGATTAIIQLSRSAICGKDTQGNQGCISWAGGVQAIKQAIALDIISSASGTFGNDAVSGEEYAAAFDYSTKRKRSSIRKRIANDVCISNRPDGCT